LNIILYGITREIAWYPLDNIVQIVEKSTFAF